MNQRSSVTARALAVTALVAGFLVLAIVVAVSLSGSNSSRGLPAGQAARRKAHTGRAASARFYVVQSGDTLSSIAHRTGVPVVRIQRLNPSVDPQVLISGEKLKLR